MTQQCRSELALQFYALVDFRRQTCILTRFPSTTAPQKHFAMHDVTKASSSDPHDVCMQDEVEGIWKCSPASGKLRPSVVKKISRSECD